jgi:CubicO group peptidase (beta-lactamase class C family)
MRLPLGTLFFTIFFILSCNNKKTESDFLNPSELNQIENLIEKAIDKNSIPGAVVLVAKNNQIIYKKAFG